MVEARAALVSLTRWWPWHQQQQVVEPRATWWSGNQALTRWLPGVQEGRQQAESGWAEVPAEDASELERQKALVEAFIHYRGEIRYNPIIRVVLLMLLLAYPPVQNYILDIVKVEHVHESQDIVDAGPWDFVGSSKYPGGCKAHGTLRHDCYADQKDGVSCKKQCLTNAECNAVFFHYIRPEWPGFTWGVSCANEWKCAQKAYCAGTRFGQGDEYPDFLWIKEKISEPGNVPAKSTNIRMHQIWTEVLPVVYATAVLFAAFAPSTAWISCVVIVLLSVALYVFRILTQDGTDVVEATQGRIQVISAVLVAVMHWSAKHNEQYLLHRLKTMPERKMHIELSLLNIVHDRIQKQEYYNQIDGIVTMLLGVVMAVAFGTLVTYAFNYFAPDEQPDPTGNWFQQSLQCTINFVTKPLFETQKMIALVIAGVVAWVSQELLRKAVLCIVKSVRIFAHALPAEELRLLAKETAASAFATEEAVKARVEFIARNPYAANAKLAGDGSDVARLARYAVGRNGALDGVEKVIETIIDERAVAVIRGRSGEVCMRNEEMQIAYINQDEKAINHLFDSAIQRSQTVAGHVESALRTAVSAVSSAATAYATGGASAVLPRPR